MSAPPGARRKPAHPMSKSSPYVWLRPTTRVERALQDAQEHARRSGVPLTQSGHLLLALVQEPQSFSALILDRLGVTPEAVRAEVARRAPGGGFAPPAHGPRAEPPPTEAAWADNRARLLDAGRQEAQALGDRYVGTEHLLFALLSDADLVAALTLDHLGVTPALAHAALSELKASHPAPTV